MNQHTLFCHYMESPIGDLLLMFSNTRLTRIVFEVEGFENYGELARFDEFDGTEPGKRNNSASSPSTSLSSRSSFSSSSSSPDGGIVNLTVSQLKEYFNGQRREFSVPLDLNGVTVFRRGVLDALSRIPFGETRSYSAIAAEVGVPRAVRAVGSACATNPIPIIVPCHRVLRSDGSIGGYLGGLEAKKTLLLLEQG